MKNPFSSARIFFHETVNELQKASWPTRSELLNSTIVVIVGIAILGVFTSISDFALWQVVDVLTSWAR